MKGRPDFANAVTSEKLAWKNLMENVFENAFLKRCIIKSKLEYKPNFAIVLCNLS